MNALPQIKEKIDEESYMSILQVIEQSLMVPEERDSIVDD